MRYAESLGSHQVEPYQGWSQWGQSLQLVDVKCHPLRSSHGESGESSGHTLLPFYPQKGPVWWRGHLFLQNLLNFLKAFCGHNLGIRMKSRNWGVLILCPHVSLLVLWVRRAGILFPDDGGRGGGRVAKGPGKWTHLHADVILCSSAYLKNFGLTS